MIKILKNKDIDILLWKQLQAESPTSSFFQTEECYRFYCSLSFLNAFAYGVVEDDKLTGIICGYIISEGNAMRRFFTKRAIVPGGLMLHPEISDSALQELLNFTAVALKRKAIYIEIRNYKDYSSYFDVIKKSGFQYVEHLNFHVNIEAPEVMLKKLSSTKRRDVKLSMKEGAKIIETTEEQYVKQYYEVLSELYTKKIKTPLFPYEFFAKLIKLECAKLFAIIYDNEVIGGSFCVVLENSILYEWFVCGKDGKYKNIFPSTLATWAAIDFAAKNGFILFDMMGAGKPTESYGVRNFKSKFGGELVENGRFIYKFNPFLYFLGKRGVQLIKKFG